MLQRIKRAIEWRVKLATGYNVIVPEALKAAMASSVQSRLCREIVSDSGAHPSIISQAQSILDSRKLFKFSDAKQIQIRGNAAEKLCFYAASRTIGREAADARSAHLSALTDDPSPLDQFQVDPTSGFLLVPPLNWPVLQDALSEAKGAFSEGKLRARTDRKTYMKTTSIPGDPMQSRIMALGRHPSMLRLVGKYLDGLPILYKINLIKSDNTEWEDYSYSSQLHHLDPEDFRQIKVFLLVSDVDDEAGPLHLLRADASDEVRLKLNYRPSNVPDETITAIVGLDPLLKCVGDAGTMAIGDTSRCFHFGSRPGKRERYVVMYQYVTPFAAEFPIDAKVAGGQFATLAGSQDLDQCLFGACR